MIYKINGLWKLCSKRSSFSITYNSNWNMSSLASLFLIKSYVDACIYCRQRDTNMQNCVLYILLTCKLMHRSLSFFCSQTNKYCYSSVSQLRVHGRADTKPFSLQGSTGNRFRGPGHQLANWTAQSGAMPWTKRRWMMHFWHTSLPRCFVACVHSGARWHFLYAPKGPHHFNTGMCLKRPNLQCLFSLRWPTLWVIPSF